MFQKTGANGETRVDYILIFYDEKLMADINVEITIN